MSRRRIRLPNETAYSFELARRIAMLDFLGLYNMAKEDDIVDRVQFVNQAEGFGDYEPKGWEMYITRLMGKCIRHWVDEAGAVVKQRQSMIYRIDKTVDSLQVMGSANHLLECRYPYGPPYNDWLWVEANRDADTYWMSTSLFREHTDIYEELARWHRTSMEQINTMQYISFNPWYGVEVRYGNPIYRGYTSQVVSGRYNAVEAYRQFKRLLGFVDTYLGHEAYIGLLYRMMDLNFSDESVIARRLRDDPEADPAEEEAKEAAISKVRDAVRNINRPVPDAEERSADLRDRFMQRLRAKRGED